MHILGLPVDNLSRETLLAEIERFFSQSGFHRIATINPEFLVLAEKDRVFRDALLDADLRIADGIGIILAGLLQGQWIQRFPGADLMEVILERAEKKNLPVYLAVKKNGLSSFEEVRRALLQKYPRLTIAGADIEKVSAHPLMPSYASLVLCNFGAPAQELFLHSLRMNPGNVRLALGVGGAFDYLTHKQQRAPHWLRRLGLEWLWRFILQPRRWRRITNATIIFPIRLLSATIRKSYRLKP